MLKFRMLRPFSTQTTLKQAQTTRPQWSHPQHRAQVGLRVAFQLLTEGTDGRLECTGAVTSPVAYLSIIFMETEAIRMTNWEKSYFQFLLFIF